jgi:ribonuclease VapC
MRRKLPAAIVDSSALICILLDEPAAPFFLDGFDKTGILYISAVTRAETWLAAFNAKGAIGAQKIEALLLAMNVETIDFREASLSGFQQGAKKHHHKVDRKARLNMGDLFTYSLAVEKNLPLFFQGTDFSNTKIVNAMKSLGYAHSAAGVPQPLNPRR